MDTLPDVVFAEAGVLNSCCCEGFLPIHAGMVVVVEFPWKGEFNV